MSNSIKPIPSIEYRPLTNMVYDLIVPTYSEVRSKANNDGVHVYLKESRSSFKEPEKYYGDYEQKAYHIFNYFKNSDYSVGALFVGDAGTGKTLLAEKICNLVLSELKLPVILTGSGTDLTDGAIIPFIDKHIKEGCIMMDEFAKSCGWRGYQDKFLSLLTSRDKKILWLFTENSISDINTFIRNRPGRVRYLINFNKLPYKVVDEYLKDYNVEENFKDDLMDAYFSATKFSFDFLQAIVSEHHFSPTSSFNDLVNILNIKSLTSSRFLIISEVKYLGLPVANDHLEEQSADVPPAENKNEQVDNGKNKQPEGRDIFGNYVTPPPMQTPNPLSNFTGINTKQLKVFINLTTTRHEVRKPEFITITEDEDRRSKPLKELEFFTCEITNNDYIIKLLEDSKLSLFDKNKPAYGVKMDKQIFSDLVKTENSISIGYSKRDTRSFKRTDVSFKDISDRNFSMKDFLKNPLLYGDSKNNIEPLYKLLESKDYDPNNSNFKCKITYDERDPYTKNQFTISNKWFEVTFRLVDDSGSMS